MKRKEKNVQVSDLGYQELNQLGYQTAEMVKTDAAEFAKVGVEESNVQAFETKLQAFKNRTYDENLLLDQKLATKEKNQASDELKLEVVNLNLLLINRIGKNNEELKVLEISSISTLSDKKLLDKVAIFVQRYEDDRNQVFSTNVSPEIYERLQQKAGFLVGKMNKQAAAKANRRIATSIRRNMANEIYDEIVRLRYTGRELWAYRDYARSTNYDMPKRNLSHPADEDEIDIDETNNWVS